MPAPTTRATAPTAAAPRRRLPALLKASLACHLGAATAVVAAPPLWPWALGSVALDHALITATGLWPRSTWLGANLRRLPAAAAGRREVALTIDDGPNPALTPAVLDLLDAHAAQATFFCIARAAERHPALCREIVRRGHSVQNHSLDHAHGFSLLGPRGYAREIGRAQDLLSQITGVAPRFFRAPAGLRNLFLAPVLDTLGLQLVSWTRRGFDTVRREPAVVLRGLTRNLAPGDIVLLHDANAARTRAGTPIILAVLPSLLQCFQDDGLRAVTLGAAIPANDAGVAARSAPAE
jgi:peptidoglycan/xylan/chitin deacetylase (PgdA/CDA1 family)